MSPILDIVVLSHQHSYSLQKCLDSIAIEMPIASVTVWIVLNGPYPAQKELERRYENLAIRWFKISQTPCLGQARNEVLPYLKGQWVLFLDDDVQLSRDYFRWLQKQWDSGDFEILAAPNLTPPDSNPFQILSGTVLASVWGAGPYAARYGNPWLRPKGDSGATLCNLIIRRQILKEATFPRTFTSGEENFLLANLLKKGCRIKFANDLYVYHERRPSLASYCKQILRYGHGRGLCAASGYFRWYHLATLLTLAYLCALIVTAATARESTTWTGLAIPLAAYLVVNMGFSLWSVEWLRRPGNVIRIFLLFPLTHLTYACGSFTGLLSGLGSRIRDKTA